MSTVTGGTPPATSDPGDPTFQDPTTAPGLSALIDWMGARVLDAAWEIRETQRAGQSYPNYQRDLQECLDAQAGLAALIIPAVASELKTIFDSAKDAEDQLRSLIKEMKAKADEMRSQQEALSTFLGIVISLIGVFNLTTPGRVIGAIGKAADTWLPKSAGGSTGSVDG